MNSTHVRAHRWFDCSVQPPSRRRFLGLSVVAALGVLLTGGSAAATPAVPCTKAGTRVIADGYIYICVRSGGRLRWRRRGRVPDVGPTPAPDPTPGASPTARPTNPSSVGVFLARLGSIPVGRPIVVAALDSAGRPAEFVLIRDASQVKAFDARCTHSGCIVAVADADLICRCHHSRFDGLSGARLAGPAPRGLGELATVIVGDGVFVLGV